MSVAFIVDTSALVAMARGEAGYREMRLACADAGGGLPAPVQVEFQRVMAGPGNRPDQDALTLISDLALQILPFGSDAAAAAVIANQRFGTGNGLGGPLNLLDLMVYATAKVANLPILCTGKDFAATDAVLHPASRPW